MKQLAIHIQKVALIDCDPQGNTSSWFLKEAPAHELADILQGTHRLPIGIQIIGLKQYED